MPLSMTVELKDKRAREALRRLREAAPDVLHRILVDAGLLIEGNAKRLIQHGSKTGRVYNYRGRKHQASARGEAPATRGGKLVGSITTHVSPLQIEAGSPLDYADYLEDVDALERPFIKPSIDSVVPSLEQQLIRAWLNAIE